MRAVVVGGGIAGLVAARELSEGGADVVLLEGSDRLGGKLHRAEVAGVVVDVGAEAMVNRRPEGVALAAALGVAVVHPTPARAQVWTRGALRPLPRTLLGAPLDPDQLAASGVLSPAGLARAVVERVGPVDGDPSVGDLVADRFGDEVTDRLVEPMLGGVYAGHARRISARAAAPQLVAMAERGSITEQAARLPVDERPVFAGIEGGMGGLVALLAADPRIDVRLGAPARALARDGAGWRVAGERADVVVLAAPAAPTARLLGDLAPAAARELADLAYASMAVVTLALPAATVPDDLDGASGFLVPPVDGRRIKAATFSFAKWDWVRAAGASANVVHLRASIGRHGEEQALQAPDETLVERALADLREATGLEAAPLETHVQRWGGGLPQYAAGHLDRVARVRADVAALPGLAVCGAAYDGVGVAAVVGSAQRAVRELGEASSAP